MKKLLLLFAFQLLCVYGFSQAVVHCNEGFSSVPPTGWTIDANASNWSSSSSTNAGGVAPEAHFYWSPQMNGTTRLISPSYDLTGVTHLMLIFKHALSHYSGAYTIGVATRSGTGSWNTVWSMVNPTSSFNGASVGVEITNADLGSSQFQFCFFFTGDSYNLNDWWIDDVVLYEPCAVDAKMISNNIAPFVPSGNINIVGTVKNFGYTAITDMTINYKIGSAGSPQSTVLSGLNIAAGANYNFSCTQPWAATPGSYDVITWISDVNSAGIDCNQTNDTVHKTIGIATQTTTRRPVFEEFTSSTCSPCASFNSGTFTPFITANGSQFSLIKYQMDWPGDGDPYYTAEGGVRRGYYGVNAVPDLYVDGRVSGMTSTTMLSELNTDKAIPTFFLISGLTPSYSGNSISIPVTITPYVTGSFKVHVVVVEKTTTGNVSTNGETSFKHVMMDMITTGAGETISFTAGTDYVHTYTADMSTTNVEEMSDLQVVVMVQENSSKEIYQSAESDIAAGINETSESFVSVYPNPATESITIANAANSDISLFDIYGKLVMSVNNIDNNFILNVTDLSKGTYIMKIINGENITSKKITLIK